MDSLEYQNMQCDCVLFLTLSYLAILTSPVNLWFKLEHIAAEFIRKFIGEKLIN